jgi:hypothetical protein
MNCAVHPDVPAVAYCRSCGKPLCESCKRVWQDAIYCEEHGAASPGGPESRGAAPNPEYSPYTAPYPSHPPMAAAVADASASPGLAFLLGLIPGVGAIYNGQYAKGLVHVIIIGLVISVLSNGSAHGLEPLLSLMLAGFWFYMAFEAYHTAQRRQKGQLVDEFSSLLPTRGGASRFPVAPVVLIALGVIFLLDNLDLLDFSRALKYWPVALIGLGAYMLYARMSPPSGGGQA